MDGMGCGARGQGRNVGGGRWGCAPHPAFYALAEDMSLNKGATQFKLGLSPYL